MNYILLEPLAIALSRQVKKYFCSIRGQRVKPSLGSIVYCDLPFGLEHTGIYVGRNRIVHLDGNGKIVSTSPQKFIQRLEGWDDSLDVYVSCAGEKAIHNKELASIARSYAGLTTGYNIAIYNCHNFVASSITLEDSPRLMTFTLLQEIMRKKLGFTEWNIWDFRG